MARSDYAHLNEDADRVWWEEEGRHTPDEERDAAYDPEEFLRGDDEWRDPPEPPARRAAASDRHELVERGEGLVQMVLDHEGAPGFGHSRATWKLLRTTLTEMHTDDLRNLEAIAYGRSRFEPLRDWIRKELIVRALEDDNPELLDKIVSDVLWEAFAGLFENASHRSPGSSDSHTFEGQDEYGRGVMVDVGVITSVEDFR